MNREAQTPHTEEPRPSYAFQGYSLPTSSTTYTPNQFFDVVLPNASRGCLRLVAFLIRKTLGWSDENGNPQNPDATISYRELIDKAGISRGAIKDAIQEALDKRFIECLRFGQPHRPEVEGFSALYSLKWDEQERYTTKPEEFDGFYAGNGNLTHIPNDFFDYTIPNEPLAVVQVIGVIIRNTIGFQTKFGFRVQEVSLSFTDIMRRTGINSRATVSKALKVAVEDCHIRRVHEGVFDPHAGLESRATVYAIRWNDGESARAEGASPAIEFEPEHAIGSKSEPENSRQNRPQKQSVQKVNRENGSKSESGNGSKSGPGTVQKVDREAFKKRTGIETTILNNTPKQQQTTEGRVAEGGVSLSLLTGKLIAEGIEPDTAARLAQTYPSERILRQIEWLPKRTNRIRSSKTGFLIRAIERDIPLHGVQTSEHTPGQDFAAYFYAELAGNHDDPTVKPSLEDIELSQDYLRRLPESEAASVLGRAFASQVQLKEKGRTSPIRTLALALRRYGDEFYATKLGQGTQNRTKSISDARARHENQLRAKYEAYTQAEIDRSSTDADVTRAFEEFSEKKLASRRRMSDRAYKMLQEELDTEKGRREFFLEFLSQTRPGTVLTFWDWDAKINNEPFSMEG